MKKATLLFIIMIFVFSCGAFAADKLYYNDAYHDYDAEKINLKINDSVISVMEMEPVIIDDSTLVPVRDVFEKLGAFVLWHDDTCSVEIRYDSLSVMLKIGDRNAYVNGNLVRIDDNMPLPMLIGKSPEGLKTMVPVRFVAEHLGCSVMWYDKTRTVSIKSKLYKMNFGSGTIPDGYGKFSGVSVGSDDKYDYICINTRYGISPEITRMTSPDRVVLDFSGASFTFPNTVDVYGNSVIRARFANYNGGARLVLDVAAPTQTVLLSNAHGIMVRTQKTNNTQITYDSFAKKIYFDKDYSGKGAKIENGYSISFSGLKMETQTIEVRDGKIYDIVIIGNGNGCSVTVDGRNDFSYSAKSGIVFGTPNSQIDKKDDGASVSIPEKTDSYAGKTVVIDPGHGGHDAGAVGYDSNGKPAAYESHVNLAIAKLVREKLTASGINVIMTREKDEYITLAGRSDLANKSGCDCFVSIHCNSIENGSVSGTQVYYHPNSDKGTIIADNIYNAMVKTTGLKPMKLQNGSHLYVIRTTTVPAVLVETAFISNPSDRTFLTSAKGQDLIAQAITDGIIKSLGEI